MQIQKYTIITPTGDRHKLFEICKKYVERQTLKPSQWIIIDDGKNPLDTDLPEFAVYIRRDPKNTDPKHTLPINLRTAFEFVNNEYIYIFEDDDWYHADYVKESIEYLNNKDLIGFLPPVYYHIPLRKYTTLTDCKKNTSFSATAFRETVIKKIKSLDVNDPYVDMFLWSNIKSSKLWIRDTLYTIGFKGFKNCRRGSSGGQHSGFYSGKRRVVHEDKDFSFLKSKIGNDIQYYNNFFS